MFPGWVSALDVADTGEKMTFITDCGDLMLGARGRLILSTSHQVQNHYDAIKGHANVENTIFSISQQHAALRARLQEADGGAMIAGVVGSVVSPAASRSWYGAGIVSVRGGSEGGGRSGRCRRVGVSCRDVGFWRRIG